MHDSTSRRSWLQTLFATFASLLLLRHSAPPAARAASKASGNYDLTTDEPVRTTTYEYDEFGRLTKVTDSPGTVTYFNYD